MLNTEELIIGFIFGASFSPVIGWYSLILAPITSFLWAVSGSSWKYNSKLFRRLGVPFLACASLYAVRGDWMVWLSLPLAFGVLTIGYGIPEFPPAPPDPGSALGRFWYKISPKYANLLTRFTIYLLLIMSFILILAMK